MAGNANDPNNDPTKGAPRADVRRAAPTRRSATRPVAVVVMTAGALLAGPTPALADGARRPTSPAAERAPSPRFAHPVDAAVIEGFGATSQPYGPGNRGLDYGVRAGSTVRSVGPGRVVFAGWVAGRRFVTVQHPDGLRSSYSYLSRIDVRVGQSVRMSTPLGLTSEEFQLGFRRGAIYIDPAPLLGRVIRRRIRLVPPAGFGDRGGER